MARAREARGPSGMMKLEGPSPQGQPRTDTNGREQGIGGSDTSAREDRGRWAELAWVCVCSQLLTGVGPTARPAEEQWLRRPRGPTWCSDCRIAPWRCRTRAHDVPCGVASGSPKDLAKGRVLGWAAGFGGVLTGRVARQTRGALYGQRRTRRAGEVGVWSCRTPAGVRLAADAWIGRRDRTSR